MKLSQTTSSEATRIGDIQNNKVGIDRNNIDFITTLLTSNLYSKPIQSFLRETVANGWDSQVEAGNTETPLLIRITNEGTKIIISIRDYGTGLSPERFNEVYLNIGSSTKRDSNDYIGQMGIGRFACLSCADIANITSYYNGVCYQYIMYKDGAGICIDKVGESPTEAENGVEVTVMVGYDWDYNVKESLIEGLTALHFYPNVYISNESTLLNSTFTDEFNQRQIHDFKTFKVTSSTQYIGCQALMGNVCYPIDPSLVSKYFPKINLPIAIVCPIGTLDVTPNRESLLYNTKTKATLEERLGAVLEEVREICASQMQGDFKTIDDWYRYMHSDHLRVILYRFNNMTIQFEIPSDIVAHYCPNFSATTIDGKPIPADLDKMYSAFRSLKFPPHSLTYIYHNKKFFQKADQVVYLDKYISKYQEGSVCCLNDPYKPSTKQYLVTKLSSPDPVFNFGSKLFISSRPIFKYFLKAVREFAKAYTNDRVTKTMKMIWRDFMKNYSDPKVFNNSDVPQSFLDSIKVVSSGKRKQARKCVVYTLVEGKSYNYHTCQYNIVTDNTLYTVDSLMKCKKTVIYADKDNSNLRDLYDVFREIKDYAKWTERHVFVEVAPTNMPILADLKNTISITELATKKNSAISRILTAFYLRKNYKLTGLNRSRGVEVSILMDNNPAIKEFARELDGYLDIERELSSVMGRNERAKALLEHLYEIYLKKGWLDIKFIDGMKSNTTFLEFRVFLAKIWDTRLGSDIAAAAFLEKRKFGVATLPTWKQLATTFNPIYQHESIQTTQPSSTDA